MRVAQVSFFRDPQSRPPERLLEIWPTLARVARAARNEETEIRVFQACHEDARVERGGVTFDFVRSCWGMPTGRRRRRIPVSGSRLIGAVARYAPDVIHVQGLGFPVLTRGLARRTGAAVFAQDHAGRLPRRVSHGLYRWGLAAVRGIGATSREQATPLLNAGLLSPRTKVFEVLESSSDFSPSDRERARLESGISGDPAVLWIGRLDAVKDPLTMLNGFRRALTHLPNAQLWCCYSDAPLLSELRRAVGDDETLRSRVHLIGHVPHAQVEHLCNAADVFVASSRREVCGFAVLEALACGLPAIITDIPPFRRLTRGGAVGALYPVGDSEALSHALLQWYASRTPREREDVRRHFATHLSFDVLGEELRAAYVGVSEGRCASR
jgi:glycosyltransferase involved in cell wall biosynthesis